MTSHSTVKNLTIVSNKINLGKTQYAAFKDLIPEQVNQKLSFELLNSNCAIANGLRRTMSN